MKNFRGSALAAVVGTPESAPHELLGSSLIFIWVTNIGTVLKNVILRLLYFPGGNVMRKRLCWGVPDR